MFPPLTTVLLTLLLPATAPAHEAAPAAEPAGPARYYFTLFGGQSVPFRHRTAHTWATFAKATPTADGNMIVEPVTISWLPADADVRPHRVRPVEGRNFTLPETFAIMSRHNAQISMWGPYEISAERFAAAAEQARFLESGAVRYRTLDSLGQSRDVENCVHAITHADPDPVLHRRIQPVLRVGEPGTSRLAAMYEKSGVFVGGPVTQNWLIPAIGADQYPVIQRQPGQFVTRRWR